MLLVHSNGLLPRSLAMNDDNQNHFRHSLGCKHSHIHRDDCNIERIQNKYGNRCIHQYRRSFRVHLCLGWQQRKCNRFGIRTVLFFKILIKKNLNKSFNLTSYPSSFSVGTQTVFSPQFAVPSMHGLVLSVSPILVIVEILTAFSCE